LFIGGKYMMRGEFRRVDTQYALVLLSYRKKLAGKTGDAVSGCIIFEASIGDVFHQERFLQGHPPHSARDVVRTAQDMSAGEHARADAGSDREEYGVGTVSGAPPPHLT